MEVEIFAVSSDGSTERQKAQIGSEQESVDWGGSEGAKSRILITLNGLDSENYIVKEFETREEAFETVKKYAFLRERGYPVPDSSYVLYYKERYCVVTPDLTEGGRYSTWALNARMPSLQYANLREINTNKAELEKVILPIAEDLDSDGCYAYRDVWMIRRAKGGAGQLEAYIVDVTTLTIGGELPEYAYYKTSVEEANVFVDITVTAV